MKRNILLFLCAFLATLGVCAGVFMLLKHRANLQADEAAAQAAAAAPAAALSGAAPAPTAKATKSFSPSCSWVWKIASLPRWAFSPAASVRQSPF